MQFQNAPLVALVILALITPLVCSGASYAHMDIGELWSESDTIIVGTVKSITGDELSGGNRIVEVEVERYVKNPSEASSIEIGYNRLSLGESTLPDGTLVFHDTSAVKWGFKEGEKVYVFLQQVTPDLFEVVGGFQGKYSIVDGMGVNAGGGRMSIPAPITQAVIIRTGFGVAVFLTIWIKRDWLSERIVGVKNG